jgi:hypothetical protein
MDGHVNLNNNLLKWAFRNSAAALAAIAVSVCMPSAQASLSFTNGSFDTLNCTSLPATCTNGAGQLDYNTNATGWTNTSTGGNLGYNFLYTSASSATSGAAGNQGNVALWPGTSPALTGPPAGGPNFIADDGAYESSAIQQVISGMTIGRNEIVTFYWAGGQQTGFSGITTEQWQVSLIDGVTPTTQSTTAVTDPSHSFTGWMFQTFSFTATNTTETLSFLAIGTPISPSEPPFVLLSDVNVTEAPEPRTFGMVLGGAGLILLCAFRSRIRRKAIQAERQS